MLHIFQSIFSTTKSTDIFLITCNSSSEKCRARRLGASHTIFSSPRSRSCKPKKKYFQFTSSDHDVRRIRVQQYPERDVSQQTIFNF